MQELSGHGVQTTKAQEIRLGLGVRNQARGELGQNGSLTAFKVSHRRTLEPKRDYILQNLTYYQRILNKKKSQLAETRSEKKRTAVCTF